CLDNVIAGLAFRADPLWGEAARERAIALLDKVGLATRANVPAGQLTYIDQKRLELARALALEPELLLLDEWLAGLNARELGIGGVVGILGANGAGKSTLLRAIAGLVTRLPGGSIMLGSRDLSPLEPHEIVEAGVALVPEGRGIFGDLTVRENLVLGAHPRRARRSEKRN